MTDTEMSLTKKDRLLLRTARAALRALLSSGLVERLDKHEAARAEARGRSPEPTYITAALKDIEAALLFPPAAHPGDSEERSKKP